MKSPAVMFGRAGAPLPATGPKGRAVRGGGEEEKRRQGRQRWKAGGFAPVPAPGGLALAALLKMPSEMGESLGSCTAEGVTGPRQPRGRGHGDQQHRFGWRDARRLLCLRPRFSVPPFLIRKSDNSNALEWSFPVAPAGAARAPGAAAAAALRSPLPPTGRDRFSGVPRRCPPAGTGLLKRGGAGCFEQCSVPEDKQPGLASPSRSFLSFSSTFLHSFLPIPARLLQQPVELFTPPSPSLSPGLDRYRLSPIPAGHKSAAWSCWQLNQGGKSGRTKTEKHHFPAGTDRPCLYLC